MPVGGPVRDPGSGTGETHEPDDEPEDEPHDDTDTEPDPGPTTPVRDPGKVADSEPDDETGISPPPTGIHDVSPDPDRVVDSEDIAPSDDELIKTGEFEPEQQDILDEERRRFADEVGADPGMVAIVDRDDGIGLALGAEYYERRRREFADDAGVEPDQVVFVDDDGLELALDETFYEDQLEDFADEVGVHERFVAFDETDDGFEIGVTEFGEEQLAHDFAEDIGVSPADVAVDETGHIGLKPEAEERLAREQFADDLGVDIDDVGVERTLLPPEEDRPAPDEFERAATEDRFIAELSPAAQEEIAFEQLQEETDIELRPEDVEFDEDTGEIVTEVPADPDTGIDFLDQYQIDAQRRRQRLDDFTRDLVEDTPLEPISDRPVDVLPDRTDDIAERIRAFDPSKLPRAAIDPDAGAFDLDEVEDFEEPLTGTPPVAAPGRVGVARGAERLLRADDIIPGAMVGAAAADVIDRPAPEREDEIVREPVAPAEIEVPEGREPTIPEEVETPATREDILVEEVEVPLTREEIRPEEIEVPETREPALPEEIEVPEPDETVDPTQIQLAEQAGVVREGVIQEADREIDMAALEEELRRMERATGVRMADERARQRLLEEIEQRQRAPMRKDEIETVTREEPRTVTRQEHRVAERTPGEMGRGPTIAQEEAWRSALFEDDDLSPLERQLEAQREREAEVEELAQELQELQEEAEADAVEEAAIEDIGVDIEELREFGVEELELDVEGDGALEDTLIQQDLNQITQQLEATETEVAEQTATQLDTAMETPLAPAQVATPQIGAGDDIADPTTPVDEIGTQQTDRALERAAQQTGAQLTHPGITEPLLDPTVPETVEVTPTEFAHPTVTESARRRRLDLPDISTELDELDRLGVGADDVIIEFDVPDPGLGLRDPSADLDNLGADIDDL